MAAREARTLDAMTAGMRGAVRVGTIAAQACKVRFLVTRLDAILGHHVGGAQVAPAVILAEMRAVARLGVMRRNRGSMAHAIDNAVAKATGVSLAA